MRQGVSSAFYHTYHFLSLTSPSKADGKTRDFDPSVIAMVYAAPDADTSPDAFFEINASDATDC